MAYLEQINPSSGVDSYAGVEVLKVFADLRLELESRGLLEYSEKPPDLLYLAINECEAILRERLSNHAKFGQFEHDEDPSRGYLSACAASEASAAADYARDFPESTDRPVCDNRLADLIP